MSQVTSYAVASSSTVQLVATGEARPTAEQSPESKGSDLVRSASVSAKPPIEITLTATSTVFTQSFKRPLFRPALALEAQDGALMMLLDPGGSIEKGRRLAFGSHAQIARVFQKSDDVARSRGLLVDVVLGSSVEDDFESAIVGCGIIGRPGEEITVTDDAFALWEGRASLAGIEARVSCPRWR